jgi:inner membrane transporter RhtA
VSTPNQDAVIAVTAARRSGTLPVTALLLCILSVQFGAGFAKHLFPVYGVALTTELRLCVGALLLLPVLRPWRLQLPLGSWPWIALFGALIGAMNFAFYSALQRIPLGIAVALEFTGPLVLAAMTSHRPGHLLWIGMAALGVVLLLPLTHTAPALDVIGVLLALLAACCWAMYMLLAQRVGVWGDEVIALALGFGALAVLPVTLAGAPHFAFTPAQLGDALMVGVFSSALPFSLEMYALTRMPTRVYGTLTSLEPAVGALMGLVILHELPTPLQAAGIAAVVAASVGMAISARTELAREP